MFPIGSIVELIDNNGINAQIGARAEVISFEEMLELKPYKTKSSGWTYFKWIRDGKSGEQDDGGYIEDRFKLVLSCISNTVEPKNNDGRNECFWCPGEKTVKRGLGRYDICPKCGK